MLIPRAPLAVALAGKHTNFELATHVPLLIRVPWKPRTAGVHATSTRAELVDLYRTLVGLAGLKASDIQSDVDGVDLSPVFDDPSVELKQYAFSQYSRCPGGRNWPTPYDDPDAQYAWFMNCCEPVPAQNISAMGYTVRSREWRFTMWFKWDGAECEALWDAPLAGSDELYSHAGHTDPGDFDTYENENVVNDPANAGVVKELTAVLLANFRDPRFRPKARRLPDRPPAPAAATLRRGTNAGAGAVPRHSTSRSEEQPGAAAGARARVTSCVFVGGGGAAERGVHFLVLICNKVLFHSPTTPRPRLRVGRARAPLAAGNGLEQLAGQRRRGLCAGACCRCSGATTAISTSRAGRGCGVRRLCLFVDRRR